MPAKRRRKQQQGEEQEDKPEELVPSKLTVKQLRDELESRGLDATGKKADLVQRLQENLDGPKQPKQVNLQPLWRSK